MRSALLWATGGQEQAMGIIEHALKIDCRYWDGLINMIQMYRQVGRDLITHQYVKHFGDAYADSVWSRKLLEIVGS